MLARNASLNRDVPVTLTPTLNGWTDNGGGSYTTDGSVQRDLTFSPNLASRVGRRVTFSFDAVLVGGNTATGYAYVGAAAPNINPIVNGNNKLRLTVTASTFLIRSPVGCGITVSNLKLVDNL